MKSMSAVTRTIDRPAPSISPSIVWLCRQLGLEPPTVFELSATSPSDVLVVSVSRTTFGVHDTDICRLQSFDGM